MSSFGKFDDSDFQAFVKHFDNEIKGEKFLRNIEKAFAEATGEALKIVKKNTRDIIYKGQSKPWRVTGNLVRGWGSSNIKKIGGNLLVEISNNQEYAIYVEVGHRGVYVPSVGKTLHLDTHWTPGRYMLAKSLDEMQKALNNIIEKEWEKAVQRLLDF